MKVHPLKDSLINELHNRPFPVVTLPAQASSMVLLNSDTREGEIARLVDFAECHGVEPPSNDADCYYQSFAGFDLRWERHSEFSTYTVIRQSKKAKSFCENLFNLLDQDWVEGIEGDVIAANHIDLRASDSVKTSRSELEKLFNVPRLVGSQVYDGLATLWTPLKTEDDGFIRTLVIDEGINSSQAGRLIRNLLEIATYRSMTLLALPIARQLMPQVRQLEQRLVETNHKLNNLQTLEDEQSLMNELIEEATQLEKLVADHSFRFSATEAYYKLTESRLDMLREKKIPTVRTLKQFHVRRFIPAFNTCMSLVKRKDDLSKRISRTSELLHLRLQLSLENQNQELLISMDKRSELQLRLQKTVEGLSVVAMTYYSISLVKLLIQPLPIGDYLPITHGVALAILTPVVFGISVMVVARIRKKLNR